MHYNHDWMLIHVGLHKQLITTAINSCPPGQNDCHFADDIFRCIFVNKKFCILIKILMKFILKGPINNNPSLIQIMAWCWTGDTILSEAMIALFGDAYMREDYNRKLLYTKSWRNFEKNICFMDLTEAMLNGFTISHFQFLPHYIQTRDMKMKMSFIQYSIFTQCAEYS